MSGLGADEAQRQLDEEINELSTKVVQLKSKRNSLLLISRIPPDTLCKIFRLLRTWCQVYGGISWVTTSHVCHHWRVAALECPSLWNYIPFRKPQWVEVMLRRSKNTPLIINTYASSHTYEFLEAAEMAFKHMNRIRVLELHTHETVLGRVVNSLTYAAPLLESLQIHQTHSTYGSDSCLLHGDFLSCDAPRLRRIDLVGCKIPWDSPFLTGLTSLRIGILNISCRPTITEIVTALGRMLSLETLNLSDSLPTISRRDHLSTPRSRLSLSHLTELSVSGSILECANFLNQFILTDTTIVSISCMTNVSEIDDLCTVLPALCALTWNSQELIIDNDWSSISLKTQNCTKYSNYRSHERPNICLFVQLTDWDGWHELDSYFLESLCAYVPFPNLKVLRIDSAERISTETWITAFEKYATLEMLDVSANSLPGLPSALMAAQRQPMSTPGQLDQLVASDLNAHHETRHPKQIPLARLRILKVKDTDFKVGKRDPNGDPDPFFKQFRDCLKARSELKMDIHRLILCKCTRLHSEDVQLLEELVVSVDWDKKVIDISDDADDHSRRRGYSTYDDRYGGLSD